MTSPRGAVALLLLAAVLAGCSGGTAASASPVATTTVDLPKSYRFAPADIVVPAGATVTWTNHDDFTHNVTFGEEAALTMPPGASVTRAFPDEGTFAYVCSLHPRDMTGSVTVGPGS
ncbi:MAG TPA: plastocyanin/azurin family copper-binding protein [Candidatus Limnocylindrales bacterium]